MFKQLLSVTPLKNRYVHIHKSNRWKSTDVSTLKRVLGQKGSGANMKELSRDTINVIKMKDTYRNNGHLSSTINPLLNYKFAFSKIDGDWRKSSSISISTDLLDVYIPGNPKFINIEDLENHLSSTYCGPLAAEFSYLPQNEYEWVSMKMESYTESLKNLSDEERLKIFKNILDTQSFDHFLMKKLRTVKKYGIEGNESVLVSLDTILETASQNDVDSAVLSMMHRGRLNTLACLLNYPVENIIHKMKGNSLVPEDLKVAGDVLSHIDQSTNLVYGDRSIHVSLIPNPSHLESSGPVAMGKCYAKQKNSSNSLCVMVHGDASVAGQGIVAETVLLSGLDHFSVGGTVHIVVNNQVGFTATSKEGRSSVYCSDIAKTVNAPVFHVNADYPEHVYIATKIAMEYRQKFKKDVWIDIIGYRKYGHNEVDEPSFTQPVMYQNIRSRKTVVDSYKEKLMESGILTQNKYDELKSKIDGFFEEGYNRANDLKIDSYPYLGGNWSNYVHPYSQDAIDNPITGESDESILFEIGEASVKYDGINLHPRLVKGFVDSRLEKLRSRENIDWATGESLAFGSLLRSGRNIRLCGQDVGRGTFSHRHMKLIDQDDENKYIIPLNEMTKDQGKLEIFNSPLSELSVLGFEYGYSNEDPNTLNIWEAQFGDFANVAQLMIDQYISSGEDKWLKQSGLVLSLPHGYEGGGPEHSSCRLERYLQSCDTDSINEDNIRNRFPNMSVIVPTTPSQIFHALKRQMMRNYRRPLIIAGPKILIRSPNAVSKLDEFLGNSVFQKVIPDPDHVDDLANNIRRVILCSGKVFYDLRQERRNKRRSDTAIIRVEELSPFPLDEIRTELSRYPKAKEYVWVQEEPQNMGAWYYVQPRLKNFLSISVKYIGLPPMASVAPGSMSDHNKVVKNLMNEAF